MDTEESKLLNIHVTICDRPYRLKVKPEEEEIVRKAARIIAEKIKDLQMQHAGNDKQDYLAMTVLTMMVEQLGAEQKTTGTGNTGNRFFGRVRAAQSADKQSFASLIFSQIASSAWFLVSKVLHHKTIYMNDTLMYVIIGAVALIAGIIVGRLIFGQSKKSETIRRKRG
jgi:cell division protein ZapA (FtsZ GTPase activity inhibitor)